jgi:hypothetical protein
VAEIIYCVGSKQKGESCRKRFECQRFKDFLTAAGEGKFKGLDMDAFNKKNYHFKVPTKSSIDCLNFKARNL